MQAKYVCYLEIIGVGYKANTDVASDSGRPTLPNGRLSFGPSNGSQQGDAFPPVPGSGFVDRRSLTVACPTDAGTNVPVLTHQATVLQLRPNEQATDSVQSTNSLGSAERRSPAEAPKYLYLKLGFSHDIKLRVPASVRVFCLKPTLICCAGTDAYIVTQFAATIRKYKPPEVYKGKGIRYRNEILVLKQGKKK